MRHAHLMPTDDLLDGGSGFNVRGFQTA